MKKSFTLIEVLVATILVILLFLAITNILSYFNNTKNILKKTFNQNDYIIKTIYYDLLNSNVLKKNKKCILSINTFNSLFGFSYVKVCWYLKNKNLIRIETPIDENFTNSLYLYNFGRIKTIKVLKNKNQILFYYEDIKNQYHFFKMRLYR